MKLFKQCVFWLLALYGMYMFLFVGFSHPSQAVSLAVYTYICYLAYKWMVGPVSNDKDKY